jgi:hypothetical protein
MWVYAHIKPIQEVEKPKEKTMTKKKFWLGMLAMTLVLGMTVVGCGDGDDNGPTDGDGFILTDIPATYNGKYAYFEADNWESGEDSVHIVGCKNINMQTETITLAQISNGKVNLSLWMNKGNSISKYSGNDAFTEHHKSDIGIFNTATLTRESELLAGIYFSSVTFSQGKVTKSANDGLILPFTD